MARVPDSQVPGVHHRRVGGDVVVTAVSDGHLDGSMAVLQNIAPEDAAGMLRDVFRPVPRRTAVNTFLIHSGGKLALVDTGCGGAMAATAGRLAANLAAAGVRLSLVFATALLRTVPERQDEQCRVGSRGARLRVRADARAATLTSTPVSLARSRPGVRGPKPSPNPKHAP